MSFPQSSQKAVLTPKLLTVLPPPVVLELLKAFQSRAHSSVTTFFAAALSFLPGRRSCGRRAALRIINISLSPSWRGGMFRA
jgi:hypothetical protein